MKAKIRHIFRKTFKIIGITILSLFLLLFLLPYIMPGTVGEKVKGLVNRKINGELNFTSARLSFFKHFPALTLTLHDFVLKGSKPFQQDTLIAASEVSFGINIPQLISGDVSVDQFFIHKGKINVFVNEKGEANYNVYQPTGGQSTGQSSPDTSTRLKIGRIVITKSNLVYNDLSSAVLITGKGLNYEGKGDLSKAIFDLKSDLKIDAFDFYYDGQPYILKKKVNAELITSINTNSLALKFQKNKLKINKLPVDFTGKFDFLTNGYDMDFRLISKSADMEDVMTAIPPQYQSWLDKTKIKGTADIIASLSGRYIAATDTMPDLNFEMKIRDGYFAYDKTPLPLNKLYLDFKTSVPGLSADSLILRIDSMYFNVDKGYFMSALTIKGIESPYINARINSEIDLEALDRALGINDYDLKGKMSLHFNAKGQYSKGQNPDRIRKEIVTISIPVFEFSTSVTNGYFHDKSLPHPISNINFEINSGCPDNNYKHTSFSLDKMDIRALNNYIKGYFKVKNADNFPVESSLEASVKLAEIRQFYPLGSVELDGNLLVKMTSNGNYQPEKKLFPKTEANFKVENGTLKTKYYPASINQIVIDATVRNRQGTMSDLTVDIKPISFEFEGKPFMIKADMHDFNNLEYDIVSKGEIDLGRIYKVFRQEGYDVQGVIETDLSLKGNQADALAQRFSRLQNRGVIKVKDIIVRTDIYPLPFFIDRGVFRFNQDQMKFEQFNARYGKSTITMNGALSNVFNYLTASGPLIGDFQFNSDYILLDEWMAYHADPSAVKPDSLAPGSSGVIIVPSDLDVKLATNIKRVDYNKLHIDSVVGNIGINKGELTLTKTGFSVADAITTMVATYRSISPVKALFSYHVVMNDFDVKKMYNEVELFRELAPAAEKAEGVIALDYNLEGKLNSDMYPIMPSLKGGGVLSVKKVKMKGFKLFSAMGKQTGKEEINDPDLSKIEFKTKINNNIVTLEKTKMKVAGFRIRIQGQTSLDGQLKLKARLGLPPFGIIGIPMNITGTGTNPKVKVGKGDELPLEEQKEEEDPN